MVRPRKLESPVLAALAEQLRFAPKAAARRQVERAEQLAALIEPESVYPEDFIVQHVTGFRPAIEAPELLRGEVVLADLGPLVERLSIAAEYGADELPEPRWWTVARVCARLGVTRRTLERYRRIGLLGRRVGRKEAPGGGAGGVVFLAEAVERFAAAHAQRLNAVTKRRRRTSQQREATGAALSAELAVGRTRAQAVRAVAAETGEARATLARAAAKLTPGSSGRRGSGRTGLGKGLGTGPKRGVVAQRALRFGFTPAQIAAKWRCSAAAVQRDADLFVLASLRGLALAVPEAASGRPQDMVRALDAARSACAGFGEPADATAGELSARAAAAGWPEPKLERVLATGAWMCVGVAKQLLEQIDRLHPGTVALDEVLTMLRCATRMRMELLRSQRRLLLETIRGVTGSELIDLEAGRAVLLADAGMRVAAEAVVRFDPFKGGRLAAPTGLAMNRVLVKLWDEIVNAAARERGGGGVSAKGSAAGGGAGAGRAVPLREADAEMPRLRDWTRQVDSWQFLTEPDVRNLDGAATIKPAWRVLLAERFGWSRYGGSLPRSLKELARLREVAPEQIVRAERAALREIARQRRG